MTPPPPPKTWMCSPPAALQQVDHVLEVLDVPALVAADRDALHVFLQRRGDDVVDAAVVAEVDDLGSHALQDAPHDVDRRVVAVEQAGGGDESHLVDGPVVGQCLVLGGKVGHGGRSLVVTVAGGRDRSSVDVDVNVNRNHATGILARWSARRRSWLTPAAAAAAAADGSGSERRAARAAARAQAPCYARGPSPLSRHCPQARE